MSRCLLLDGALPDPFSGLFSTQREKGIKKRNGTHTELGKKGTPQSNLPGYFLRDTKHPLAYPLRYIEAAFDIVQAEKGRKTRLP
ncbi:uncharacterized protein CLUP02_12193 [Colletotrichum lupini]|uniref:Uncharacterized protein n=1 Tax=Colletotrichum lupini TaxID=145971 RepID=A0A9Q8WKJ5_9PEZI|nr:uncharacterized protein CLUP02_12193 [Colletotrichum lupini]UQC86691.1 hypothetical protein CLUP02_12193 [Colletotrichum lupini]